MRCFSCYPFALLVVMASSFGRADEPVKLSATPALRTDIEFAKVGDVSLTLDAFVPEGPGPFPTCILVHGGGFVRGDKQTFIKPLFAPLSEAGFTWFTINYRLAPEHRWPACADDVETAVRWVKSHAKEYKVNANRIALIGESAGGHLVSYVGCRSGKDLGLAAVIPFYAPHDLEFQVKSRNALGESMQALFGLTEINEDAWKQLHDASPSTYVHSGMPPYLLIHGTKDAQVPYAQSPRFQEQMKAAGNACDLITIAEGAHGMGGWEKLGSNYQQQLVAWLKTTLNEPAAPSPPEGFRAIFNGKDLAGWEGSPDYWSVKDGCLTGVTDGSLKYNRFIIWRGGTLKNFELGVQVNVTAGGNSGLNYRSKHRPDLGDGVVTGYQCDVVAAQPDYNGMLYEERGRRILAHTGEKVIVDVEGQPWVVDKFPVKVFEPGQWHDFRVLVRGNHHQHWIDDHPTADLIDLDEKNRALEGILGVQVHVGPAMQIQYRNFFVKDLSDDLPIITPDRAKIPASAVKVVPQGQPKKKK